MVVVRDGPDSRLVGALEHASDVLVRRREASHALRSRGRYKIRRPALM